MGLPLVVEIAIGLVFVYLILSLLTSELQELIATVLQWRAEHLKKSIETLLTGEYSKELSYRKFVGELYNSPLIRSLNHQAKGGFAEGFRRIANGIIVLFRQVTRSRNVFGQQTSAPSYIPPDTFSVALLQTLNLSQLNQTISEITAQRFRDESLDALRDILEDLRMSLGDDPFSLGEGSLMEKEFKKLEANLDHSVSDFIGGRASLSASLNHIAEQLTLFIDNADALLSDENHCKEVIRRRLLYLKRGIARKHAEPTLTEVLRLIMVEDPRNPRFSPWAAEVVEHLNRESPELVQTIATLPTPLKQNLLSLTHQARTKANSLEDEFRQLEREVAHWFNQSMERASGVYRRNAKGIALLIGFLVAVLINADTLHMIDRLSRDTLLRTTMTQAAQATRSTTAPTLPTLPNSEVTDAAVPTSEPARNMQTSLTEVQDAVNQALDDVPLPIGWSEANRTVQQRDSQTWAVPILRPIIGWTITGVALSMGSTFWFDILSRVIRVRSTGDKPEETKKREEE